MNMMYTNLRGRPTFVAMCLSPEILAMYESLPNHHPDDIAQQSNN